MLVLLGVLQLAACEEYCIRSSREDVESNSSCFTLSEFASSNFSGASSVALLFLPGIHYLNVELSLFNAQEFRLIGTDSDNSSSVQCVAPGKVVVENVDNVSISSLNFMNCGKSSACISHFTVEDTTFHDTEYGCAAIVLREITSTEITRSSFTSSKGGAIHVMESTSVKCSVAISHCTFSDNEGVAILSNSVCSVTISNSNFTDNTYCLFFAYSDVRLIDSYFTYNHLPSTSRSTNFEALIAGAYSMLSMSRCLFQANEAKQAGGIILMSNSRIYGNDLVLSDNKAFEGSLVMNQCAANFSGTTKFSDNDGSLVSLRLMVRFYGDVSFVNNSPSTRNFDDVRGGAITLYFGELHLHGPTEISNNHANMGGAILAVESAIHMLMNVNISNNTADYIGGGIFAYKTPINALSNVLISNSEAEYGGGIYAVSTSITVTSSETSLSHALTITNNTAIYQGGGLYFSSNSRLYVYQLDPREHDMNASLTFNSAQLGGAIYVADETYVNLCQASQLSQLMVDSQCVFQVVDLYRNMGNLHLFFDSNAASESGSVMYGGLLDRCIVSPLTYFSFFNSDIGPSLRTWNGMAYLRNVSNIVTLDSIASCPVRVCFCFENKPDCSVEHAVQQVEQQKGRKFKVVLIVLDQADHPLANVTVFMELLQSTTGGLGDGLQSQMVNEGCTELTCSVTSTSSRESLTVYPEGPCGSAMLSR